MKKCAYCGAEVKSDTNVCPHCNASEFIKICHTCGAAYTEATCPVCEKKREEDEAIRAEKALVDKNNKDMVWKTVLTVLLPFVGGYFLVKPGVKTGFTVFALIWCAIFFIATLTSESLVSVSLPSALLALLIAAGPILYWAYLKFVKKAR